MAMGTLTVTGGGGSEELVAADANRDYIVVQLQSAHPAYFGFGETAVTLMGASLIAAGDSFEAFGHKARGVINVIAAGNAVIGWETMQGLKLNTNS